MNSHDLESRLGEIADVVRAVTQKSPALDQLRREPSGTRERRRPIDWNLDIYDDWPAPEPWGGRHPAEG